MTRRLRTNVWAAAVARNPAKLASAGDPLIIDLDASLTHVHSLKEDGTGEVLAV